MTEPMDSLLVFTKNWGFVGRHKVFPDDVALVFAFLMLKVFVISSELLHNSTLGISYFTRMETRLTKMLKKF